MSKSHPGPDWQQQERGSSWGMLLLAWILRHGGEVPCRLVMVFPVAWFCLFPGAAGTASRRYLRRARAAGAPVPRLFPVCRHFWDFSCSLLEKFAWWSGRPARVEFPEAAALQAAIDGGEGGLLVGAHFGNLDGLRALAGSCRGLRLVVFIEQRHAPRYHAVLSQSTAASGGDCRLVSSEEVGPALAGELIEHVRGGGFVVLLADRAAPGGGGGRVEEELLGAPVRLPDGPWRLAQLLQCPLWSAFCWRDGGGHRVEIERLSAPLPRRDGGAAAAQARRLWLRRLEALILRQPLQWYNFFDFWDEGVP